MVSSGASSERTLLRFIELRLGSVPMGFAAHLDSLSREGFQRQQDTLLACKDDAVERDQGDGIRHALDQLELRRDHALDHHLLARQQDTCWRGNRAGAMSARPTRCFLGATPAPARLLGGFEQL